MWRRAPFTASMPVPTYASDDVESHAHSPRRRATLGPGETPGCPIPTFQGMTSAQSPAKKGLQNPHLTERGNAAHLNDANCDVFHNSRAYFDWLGNTGIGTNDTTHMSFEEDNTNSKLQGIRKTSTDISMPDYMTLSYSDRNPCPDPQFVPSHLQDEESNTGHTKVPENTPTPRGMGSDDSEGIILDFVV